MTLLVTPDPASARTVMERVPAESTEPNICRSAPIVRPVVSMTARIMPITISTVTADAAGWERAEAPASRMRLHITG